MKGLLWREYRRNRLILAKAVVLIPLPHIVEALITWPAAEGDSAYFHAYLFSTFLSAMIVVGLAGNSIAPDHADRSGEFISYLPFGRFQKLACKLLLPLTAVVVLCFVNLTIQMPALETWPVGDWPPAGGLPERLHWSLLLASSALGICGVSWCVSSIQSSSALAVMGGVAATILVLGRLRKRTPCFRSFRSSLSQSPLPASGSEAVIIFVKTSRIRCQRGFRSDRIDGQARAKQQQNRQNL